jgi:flavin-dependent dehydrogenase
LKIVIDVAIVGGGLAGSHWLLIGDAAGHVNPIMGEGIIYALLDGELAAQAIIDKNCQQFDTLWRKSYGQALFRDITLQEWLHSRLGLEFYCLALGFKTSCTCDQEILYERFLCLT